MAFFQNFLAKEIQSIILVIFYDKSLSYPSQAVDFVASQINKSPFHIKFVLLVLTLIFAVFGLFSGFYSSSFYKKIRAIEIFENLCKTTRMYISFIRSMALIYACDNGL